MKPLFISILLASYVAAGIFGIFVMHAQADMDMQEHTMPISNCIGAIAKGVDCPKQVNSIDFATFHINAFKEFSLATFGFGKNLITIILFVLATLIFIGVAFFASHLFKIPKLEFYRQRFKKNFSLYQQQRFIRWLALHEKSPTASF